MSNKFVKHRKGVGKAKATGKTDGGGLSRVKGVQSGTSDRDREQKQRQRHVISE